MLVLISGIPPRRTKSEAWEEGLGAAEVIPGLRIETWGTR